MAICGNFFVETSIGDIFDRSADLKKLGGKGSHPHEGGMGLYTSIRTDVLMGVLENKKHMSSPRRRGPIHVWQKCKHGRNTI